MQDGMQVSRETGRLFEDALRKRLAAGARMAVVADDDAGVRAVVSRGLHELGLDVYEAASGEAVFDCLRQVSRVPGSPLLLLLDLDMPGMDGWQVLERLRADQKLLPPAEWLPVVVLSGHSGDKRMLFSHTSVHDPDVYGPLLTVAKLQCLDRGRYDAAGWDVLLELLRGLVAPDPEAGACPE